MSSDIEEMGLSVPKKDYIPITLEEELVCYADMFHSKYPRFITFEEAYEGISKLG
jgi:uncharacterized protein